MKAKNFVSQSKCAVKNLDLPNRSWLREMKTPQVKLTDLLELVKNQQPVMLSTTGCWFLTNSSV
jgi:hypothetical protein